MKFHHILVVLLAGLLLTGCGSKSDPAAEEANQGYNYASGSLNFSVLLNGVGTQVNTVQTRSAAGENIAGYTFVTVNVSIVNESDQPVVPGNFVLVDELMNQYKSWQTNVPFANELQSLPLAVGTGEEVTGDQVYIVPNSALGANLRLRWESTLHESRIEIFLGPLSAG